MVYKFVAEVISTVSPSDPISRVSEEMRRETGKRVLTEAIYLHFFDCELLDGESVTVTVERLDEVD